MTGDVTVARPHEKYVVMNDDPAFPDAGEEFDWMKITPDKNGNVTVMGTESTLCVVVNGIVA